MKKNNFKAFFANVRVTFKLILINFDKKEFSGKPRTLHEAETARSDRSSTNESSSQRRATETRIGTVR